MLLNWRAEAAAEGRTATQILAANQEVIRDLEEEGLVPAGIYEQHVHGNDCESYDSDTPMWPNVENLDPSEGSFDHGKLGNSKDGKQNHASMSRMTKQSTKKGTVTGSMPEKVLKKHLYVDSSDEDERSRRDSDD